MVFIKVYPSIVNAAGLEYPFGDETGTPQFYTVRDVLKKHLGKDIYVYYNYDDFTFEIVYDEDATDQGCDISYDFVEGIESICELFPNTHYGGRYNGFKLQFKIVHITLH
uniref:Uncharacterized protein n=1 Tax=viral metagenome TaxID=1070528 RepID=A0A6C0HH10_9ZZZZ